MRKKCIVGFLIICAVMGLLVPCCLCYKVKINEYQTIRVKKLYYNTSSIDYPQQFLNIEKIDEWLRYNQKQYYSIYFPPTEFSFHRIDFSLNFDPGSKYRCFHFSEKENKVFYNYYRAHGAWGYTRELTDIDREFLQFLKRCFEEQGKIL